MKRSHRVIVRACSWLAGRTGALIIGLAMVWVASAPSPMWGQWNGTNPVWTNSSVGIGTTNPLNLVQVRAGTNYNLGIRYDSATNSIGFGAYNDAGTVPTPLGFNAGSFMFVNGNVGIGTTNPQYLLSVNGTIGTKDVIVTNAGWSDFVFRPGYRLKPLGEVNAYIQTHHHLPDIPSEAEVKEKGVSVGDMQAKLLAKVEELTLHMIQADERNNRLEQQNQELRDRMARLEKSPAADAMPTAAK